MIDLFQNNDNTNNLISNSTPELSVSEISNAIKKTVENEFSYIRVRGELSGVKFPTSGHIYMDLKDDKSVIKTVCWRGNANKLNIKPEDGLEVIITGKVTTYGARSNYQLIVQSMEVAGIGALLKILDDRKKKLQIEGLFDKERKKTIPKIPRCIGIITSPTGAVIRDILHRIDDRFPRPVLVYPVKVQGDGADIEISRGIEFFNNPPQGITKPDVIIIARGGGSIEDLWSFNEEIVVRATANSQIPIISAVGHETDITLIDHVADLRVPTPTAAAEMAVPVLHELRTMLMTNKTRLDHAIYNSLEKKALKIESLQKSLPDMESVFNFKSQRLDDIIMRFTNSGGNVIKHWQNKLDVITSRLTPPSNYIKMCRQSVLIISKRLNSSGTRLIEISTAKLNSVSALLESYSFKKTLQRGFAIIRDENDSVIKNTQTAKNNSNIKITFADGDINANIKK